VHIALYRFFDTFLITLLPQKENVGHRKDDPDKEK